MKLRILPALIIASSGLLVMKIVELIAQDHPAIMVPVSEPGPLARSSSPDAAAIAGRTLKNAEAARAGPIATLAPSPAEREYPGLRSEPLYTGSTAPKTEKKQEPPPAPPTGQPVTLDAPAVSPAERSLLERLGARRQQLDERERQLDTQESLLKAADKKLESRINELRELEQKTAQSPQKEAEQATLKNLVTMYETMKPKEAARVFDKLDLKVLTPVATAINPRKMAEILAAMSPESASKLTIELAGRSKRASATGAGQANLPSSELQAIETPRKP